MLLGLVLVLVLMLLEMPNVLNSFRWRVTGKVEHVYTSLDNDRQGQHNSTWRVAKIDPDSEEGMLQYHKTRHFPQREFVDQNHTELHVVDPANSHQVHSVEIKQSVRTIEAR